MSSLNRVKHWISPPENDVGNSLFDHTMDMSSTVGELDDDELDGIRREATDKLDWVDAETGTVNDTAAERLFAIVRKHRPETIVETGVCNGLSTLHLLLALKVNDTGTLHSIDYPFRADRNLEEFRRETYDDFGGAQIPADKDSGWIIPDELRDRWTLREGKSQIELPRLLTQLEEIDMFIHDSEHSSLCMAMEMDLAWHHLTPGGILVVDDISWSDAWDEFLDERNPAEAGLITQDVAFAQKREL